MTIISPSDAFLLFGKWRDEKSSLEIGWSRPGKDLVGMTGNLLACSSSSAENSLLVTVAAVSSGVLWRLPLSGASFHYGEPADSAWFPEFEEGKWSAYLRVVLPDGSVVFFAERCAN